MTEAIVIALVILGGLLLITFAAAVAFVVGNVVFGGRRGQRKQNSDGG